eukprot:gb/GFBE01012077.1/.p1 GENE.gb/GFBE01012077.1/~~gb/GFBE01012077.1/.p1  ORF type:complete len:405 (+),score=78.69 gb/GFBE01012077.1/:1-1215(+)
MEVFSMEQGDGALSRQTTPSTQASQGLSSFSAVQLKQKTLQLPYLFQGVRQLAELESVLATVFQTLAEHETKLSSLTSDLKDVAHTADKAVKAVATKSAVEIAAAEDLANRAAAAERAVLENAAADRAAEAAAAEQAAKNYFLDCARLDDLTRQTAAATNGIAAQQAAPVPVQSEPEVSGTFRVVHERVAIRKASRTTAESLGSLKKLDIVEGSVEIIDGVKWLQLSEQSTRLHATGGSGSSGSTTPERTFSSPSTPRTNLGSPGPVKRAWVLIDGSAVGAGTLLTLVEGKNSRGPLTPAEKLNLASSFRPGMADQLPGSGRLWVVTGGQDYGGIIVRAGESTQSLELPSKLSTGSTIEELELRGGRLYYRRIKGDGPDYGWVSCHGSGGQFYVEPFDDSPRSN